MTDLLQRIGFVYKKTKIVPGKADPERQQEYLDNLEKLKESKNPEAGVIYAIADNARYHKNKDVNAYKQNAPPSKKPALSPLRGAQRRSNLCVIVDCFVAALLAKARGLVS